MGAAARDSNGISSLGETWPGSCGGNSSQVSGPASPGNGVRKYDTFLPRTFKNLRTPKRDRNKICLLPVVAVWLAVAPVAYILQRAAASRVIGQESAGSQEPGAATLTRGSHSYTLLPCPLSGDPSTIPAQGAATLTRGSPVSTQHSYTLLPCPLSGDPSTIPAQGAATLTRGSPVSTQHREPRHYHATVSPLTDPHKET